MLYIIIGIVLFNREGLRIKSYFIIARGEKQVYKETSINSTFELIDSTIKCLKMLIQLYQNEEVDYKLFAKHSNKKLQVLRISQDIICEEILNTIKEVERMLEL